MIKISKDNGTVEPFTLVLSSRNQEHLGQISNVDNVNFKANLNGADELSFSVYKVADDHEEILWDEIFDLRLVWVKELDEYFEINVELTDKVRMEKTITATSLCESELSQVYLHNIEINTELDISREDYDVTYPTVFYRNPDEGATLEEKEKLRTSSLLHRILEKVPAYTIKHVDDSLKNIQRIFSISDQTVYDFLTGDCASQFNCIFMFDSKDRSISVYDLYTVCETPIPNNTTGVCGYRGDFTDVCPKCGGKKLKYFGEDTTIFVSTANLTDEVRFETDVASIKNCFRLEAGDEDMTAAIINSNPNGSRYIYEFSPESRRDMPKDLVDLMDQYDKDYIYYNTQIPISIDSIMVQKFNELCNKYNDYTIYNNGSPWNTLPTIPLNGYSELIPYYYECIDFASYLKSSMMPPVIIPKTTVAQEAAKISLSVIGELGVAKVPTNPVNPPTTINSAMVNWAKVHINSGFVKIAVDTDDSNYPNAFTYTGVDSSTGYNKGIWTGRFKLTNFEDDTDIAYSSYLTVTVTDNLAEFMEQKIAKFLTKNTEDLEQYQVMETVITTTDSSGNTIIDSTKVQNYKNKLKLWSAARLLSFHDAIEAVIGILIEADQGNKGTPALQYMDKSILYDDFYTPYYKKLELCQEELDLRNQEIALIWGNYNDEGMVVDKGIIQYIVEEIGKVHTELNFKEYLKTHAILNGVVDSEYGEELYNIYTTYIREDTYSNSNYISDDLDNNQLFKNAGLFFEVAKEELHKSATYQHSISSNINNLLTIPEFSPIVDKFELGNWIRIQADETIYRLRLISYSVDDGSYGLLNTEFSDVTITSNGVNDIQSLLKQASSMASSYGYVEKQAERGSNVKSDYIDDWVENGLNSALVRINNNDDEDITIDNVGITAKSYDDVTDGYSDEQLRITHNVLAFTDDNWASVKTALGKFSMTHHKLDADGINRDPSPVTGIERYDTYGLVADAVLAGWIVGSHMESGTIIASYLQNPGNENYIDLGIGAGDTSDFIHTTNFQVDGNGTITSSSGRFQDANNNYYIDMGATGTAYTVNLPNFTVTANGDVAATGNITATSGTIGAWTINPLDVEAISTDLKNGSLSFGTPGTTNSALLSPYGYKVTSGHGYTFGGTNSGEHIWVQTIGTKFAVDNTGSVYLSDGNFNGNINCGNFVVDNNGDVTISGSKTFMHVGGGDLVVKSSSNRYAAESDCASVFEWNSSEAKCWYWENGYSHMIYTTWRKIIEAANRSNQSINTSNFMTKGNWYEYRFSSAGDNYIYLA